MDQLQNDLREFVELLLANKVEFVVVGAYAVAFHGYPRYTQDIDLFVRSSASNARKLTVLIRSFGFESLGLKQEDFYDPDVVIQLGHPPNRIDVITRIDGVTFDRVWENKVEGDLDGLNVYFIDLESLLLNKASTGRAKDKGDAEELVRRKGLDASSGEGTGG